MSLFGQSYQAGKLYVRVTTTSAIPQVSGTHPVPFQFQDSVLNNLWQPYSILEFTRAFPGVEQVNHANAEPLSRVYEVTCTCDENTLMNDLQQNANSYKEIPILKLQLWNVVMDLMSIMKIL